MPALNHLGYLGIQKEVVWGTPIFSALDFGEILSEGIKATPTPLISAGINGTRTMNKRVSAQKVVAGPFSFEVNPEDIIGNLLKAVLPNEVFVDDGGGNGGQHTFTPGNTLPPGITVQVGRGRADNVKNYAGFRPSQLGFTVTPDGFLVADVDGPFKDESDGVLQVPVFSAENPFKGADIQATIRVDGVEKCLRNFNVAIATGLIGDRFCLGKNVIQQPQPGVYDVTGGFEMFYDDEVEVNKVIDHQTFSVDLKFLGTLIGATQRAITITIPNAFYNGETASIPSREGEGLVPLTFQAIKIAGQPLISVKLDNSVQVAY